MNITPPRSTIVNVTTGKASCHLHFWYVRYMYWALVFIPGEWLQPVNWEWCEAFQLEISSVLLRLWGDTLWVITPITATSHYMFFFSKKSSQTLLEHTLFILLCSYDLSSSQTFSIPSLSSSLPLGITHVESTDEGQWTRWR